MVAHDRSRASGRAGLPHPALAPGSDAKAAPRIRMIDAQRRQPAFNEPPHSVSFHPAAPACTRWTLERLFPGSLQPTIAGTLNLSRMVARCAFLN
jgi:hypothetical protein